MKHISHSVGMINKRNCRIWGSENSRVIEERLFITSRKSQCLVRSLIQRCDWLGYRPICIQKLSKIVSKDNACNTSRGGHLNYVIQTLQYKRNVKKIFYMYDYFWNHEIENPIFLKKSPRLYLHIFGNLSWSLQPFSQDYDIASHTTYVVWINFIHERRDYRSKSTPNARFKKKKFIAIFSFSLRARNLLRGSCRKNIVSYCVLLQKSDLWFVPRPHVAYSDCNLRNLSLYIIQQNQFQFVTALYQSSI